MDKYFCVYVGDENILEYFFNEFTYFKKFVKVILSNDVDITTNEYNYIVFSNKSIKERYGSMDKNVMLLDEYIDLLLANSFIIPRRLRIDFSTLCQLNCKTCYMRLSNNGTMGYGYLKFENFYKLINENPEIREIETSNSGELFLNPDLIDIVKYAYEHNVALTAYNGVNMNTVTDIQLEALVKYKFKGLTISIDGASNEVYEIYRQNGKFDVVLDNVKKLLYYKNKYRSQYPIIRWQYIIMQHNEKDIVKAKTIAKELGIPIEFKLTWDKDYIPNDIEMLRKETGLQYFTRGEYSAKAGDVYFGHLKCMQTFLSPQINWDGRLLGCCSLYKQDYGINVFNVGLENALRNEKYVAAKKYLLYGIIPNDQNIPCIKCNTNCKRIIAKKKIKPISDYYCNLNKQGYIPYS